MHTFTEISGRFEKFLEKESLFPSEPVLLYEPCRYLLQAGGKRIRPALCLMGQELFSPLTDEAFQMAAALELFHNFTLIHDDIMDEAPLRRGRPAVHIKYGRNAGILSGDVMCIQAYRLLESLSPEHYAQLFPAFNQMAIKVCEGQQWDFEFESKDEVSIDEYLKMIELKTSVLIAHSLQSGAVLGGATASQTRALYDFGRFMGIAFQLQDDYLDVFGAPELTGKQPGGDILAGKKSILYVHYHELINDTERKKFNQIYLGNEAEKVKRVTDLWRAAGLQELVRRKVEAYTDKAFAMLQETGLEEEKTKELTVLFRQLMNRKS